MKLQESQKQNKPLNSIKSINSYEGQNFARGVLFAAEKLLTYFEERS